MHTRHYCAGTTYWNGCKHLTRPFPWDTRWEARGGGEEKNSFESVSQCCGVFHTILKREKGRKEHLLHKRRPVCFRRCSRLLQIFTAFSPFLSLSLFLFLSLSKKRFMQKSALLLCFFFLFFFVFESGIDFPVEFCLWMMYVLVDDFEFVLWDFYFLFFRNWNPNFKHLCSGILIDLWGFDFLNGLGPAKMSSLSRELVFLILQFLDEEKFKDTVHR